MNISEYETIEGITVPTADVVRVTAKITKAQRILEGMLGFTLDSSLIDTNQYVEIGKTPTDCPCVDDVDIDNLDDPDAVIFAYRMFNYNEKDKTILIDPCSDIHAVKLVHDGITFKTLDADEYLEFKALGFIKYIEQCLECDWCNIECSCVQLAVDATWLWETVPDDLNQVWADMTTYYSDLKNNIKSETLGTHSYSKFNDKPPEQDDINKAVIDKYLGSNGSARRILTV